MMKSIKKGEVIIYVIALMLVAAGYLNYTSNRGEENTVETYSEDIANIGDAVLVSNNDIDLLKDNSEDLNQSLNENSKEKEDISTSAVPLEEKEGKENTDYFTASKLERDTMYANMISSYTNIIENKNIDDTQKSIANQEITKINNNKNAIMICENILSTKGFSKCVIFINSSSINVVIEDDEELTKEKVAQIQNVISRELDSKIENIHISQKES